MKIKCKHCRRIIPGNPRIKNQAYCNRRKCQNERRRLWRKNKLKTDPQYRSNKADSQKRWADKNPDYWKEYRATHPEYVEMNRKRQLERNKCRCANITGTHSMIAKSDALDLKKDYISGLYMIIPATRTMIAKSDAKFIEIRSVSMS